MKKHTIAIISSVILFLFSGILFPADVKTTNVVTLTNFTAVTNAEAPADDRFLLRAQFRLGKYDFLKLDKMYQMQQDADFLTYEQKTNLYVAYKKPVWSTALGFYLNLMTLPGVGNFAMGDREGGTVILTGTILGALLTLGGSALYGMGNYNTYMIGQLMIMGGIGFVTIFEIAGLITPFFYTDHYNKNLALALKLRQEDVARYDTRLNTAVPMMMNVFPGFGLGSFQQGDVLGGSIQLVGSIAGWTFLTIGLATSPHRSTYSSTSYTAYYNILDLNGFFFGGIGILAANTVLGIMFPYLYAADFQKKMSGSPERITPKVRDNDMGPALPVILNIVPGFGMGSLVQRDPLGGVIGVLGEMGGAITALIGLNGYFNAESLNNYYLSDPSRLGSSFVSATNAMRQIKESALPIMIVGLSIYGAVKLFNIIRPFWFYGDMKKVRTIDVTDTNTGGEIAKRDATGPVLLNILPGFGVGSFVQGDVLGGVIGLIGEAGGAVCSGIGVASMVTTANALQLNPENYDTINPQFQSASVLAIIGFSVYGITKIFEVVRAATFVPEPRAKKSALLQAEENTFSFNPYVVPALDDGKMDMQFGMKMNLAF